MEIERVCANCHLKDDEGYCSVLAYALRQAAWLDYRGGKVKPAFDDGCSLFEPSQEALDDFRRDCQAEIALALDEAAQAGQLGQPGRPGQVTQGRCPWTPPGGQLSPRPPRVRGHG
jgi:hypothetical protein